MSTFVEPKAIADLVEYFVNAEHDNAEKYINRTPLDESGVWSLHQLAARIYAAGFEEGARVEGARSQGSQRRSLQQGLREIKAERRAAQETKGETA